jgi:hypothetical protein
MDFLDGWKQIKLAESVAEILVIGNTYGGSISWLLT